MFNKIRDFSLSTVDKATRRANTLFTSMKDKEEERKKPKSLGFSIFDKDEEKPKEIEQKAYDKAKTTIDKEKEGKEKMQKRADILYPDSKIENLTEKNQKEKFVDVFEEKKMKGNNKLIETQSVETNNKNNYSKKDIKNLSFEEIEKSAQTENDKHFFTALKNVLKSEGKYVNNPNDKGGPTNMGITQDTYDDFCKRNGLKTKDVKNLSTNEAMQVYYKDYWVKTGLDKEKDPIKALILFDTATLHGRGRTKEFYKKSNGDLNKFLDLREKHYIKKAEDNPTQKEFFNGWINRNNRLKEILKRYEETQSVE